MKILRLTSAKNIRTFLESTVVKAVEQARSETGIESQKQSNYAKKSKDFNSMISEVEDEDVEDTEEDVEDTEEDVEEDEAPVPPEEEDDLESEPETEGFAYSLGTLVDQINSMRSGKSATRGAINSELQVYFGGLDDAEKVALTKFMKGIAQVLTGLSGEKAVEPEDEPDPVDVVFIDKVEEPPEEPEEGVEDATTPIKVAEEMVRNAIHSLLSKERR